MWNYCTLLTSEELQKFESTFNFRIQQPLRSFLLEHNGGRSHHCIIPSLCKDRKLEQLLDFSATGNAWEINRRMRKILGTRCIVIGTDRSENFLCVTRAYNNQSVVIWNHVTGELEQCSLDIPALLDSWGG